MKNKYLFLFLVGLVLSVFDGKGQVNLQVNANGTSAICQAGAAVQLTSTHLVVRETTGYTVSSITPTSSFSTNPPFSTSLTQDDVWSQIIDLKGGTSTPFNFCYFGNTFSKSLLCTNGVISFSIAGQVPGGRYTPAAGAGYIMSTPIPSDPLSLTKAPYYNAIHGVFQDTFPNSGANINYYVDGSAPNRAFVFSMTNVPNFSCSTVTQSSQIVMYEGTNIIDVYIIKRSNGCSWQGGVAAVGIQDNTGAQGYSPTNRNLGAWNVPATSPEAYRFTPSGSAVVPVSLAWKDSSGTVIGTGANVTVNPMTTTTYTVEATYTICGLPYTVSDDVTVTITDINTGAPSDIVKCDVDGNGSESFDLTQNTAQVMNGLDSSQYIITYHTTSDGANGITSEVIPDADLDDFISSGQTIWVAVEDFFSSFSCKKVQQFNLILIRPIIPIVTTTPPTCSSDGVSTITNYNNAPTSYTFSPAGPTVGAGGVISGMVVGTAYTVNTGTSTCTSPMSLPFTNLQQLPTPAVPTTASVAATCSADGSSSISNYVATNTYTFSPTGPIVGAGGAITGMTTGTLYTVTANNGTCSSAPSASFSNAAQLAIPATPILVTAAPTCSADGSTTVSNYDPTLTYAFTPAGPTVGAGGLISGMTVGTSYTVVSSNTSCSSPVSAPFSNAAQLVTPAIPTTTTTAPTCSATGSTTITNYNAAETYAFTPAGPSVGAGGLISGMTVGTSYTVTASASGCTSVASAPFNNAAQLVTPAVPTISSVAATCSADGSSSIANYDPANSYAFTPAGPTVSATGAISGMTLGTAYTVTANNGSCTSAASAPFTNVAQLTVPLVPTTTTTAPTCSATSETTITNYVATNTYIFSPSGPTVGAGGVISGMTVGTPYTVVASNGSCASTSSTSFTNAAQLVTPAVPTVASVAATCSADGSSSVSNYDPSVIYVFNPAGPTVGAGGLISGMTLGASYTVTASNASCTSAASSAFSNAAQLSIPLVPTTTTSAPTCAAASSTTITNYVATNSYVFTPAGPTVGAGGVISGMTIGTSYSVIASNGSCASTASAPFSNAAQLVTPAIPTITSVAATCSAAGSSSISNYVATNTYTFAPAGPTVGAGGLISGMVLGTSYNVSAGNGSCTSAPSAAFSNGAQLVTPAVPVVASAAPICSASGSSTITNYNAALTYVFSPSGPSVGAGGVISGMTVGSNYSVVAGNGSCSSAPSASFSNAPQLTTITPTFTQVAPICAGAPLAALPTTSNNGISGSWSPPVMDNNATTTYTFTPVGVSCATTASMTIVVNQYVTPTFTQISGICSGNSLSPLPTTSSNGITGVWSPAPNNMATTLYTFTPNAGQCANTAQMTITVTPKPIVTFTNNTPVICSGDAIDIVLQSNNVPGATIHWQYVSPSATGGSFGNAVGPVHLSDILTLTAGIVVPTTVTYTVYAEGGCLGDAVRIDVLVNPKPVVTHTVVDDSICSGTQVAIDLSTIYPGATFEWYSVAPNVNGASNATGVPSNGTGPEITDTLSVIGSSAGTVEYHVTAMYGSCRGPELIISIDVNPLPIANFGNDPLPICSGEPAPISMTSSNTNVVFQWTLSLGANVSVQGGVLSGTSADNNFNPSDVFFNSGTTDATAVYTIVPMLGDCAGQVKQYTVLIHPLPIPNIEPGFLCIGADGNVVPGSVHTLDTGLSSATHTFVWYHDGVIIPGATGSSYTVDEADEVGMYSVEVTNTATTCQSGLYDALVAPSNVATPVQAYTSNYFSDNATITAVVNPGSSAVQYSLDGGPFQDSNVFTGVLPGPHTITVIDENGCTNFDMSAFVIDYPHFFTPNGDGHNDTWNIWALDGQPGAEIMIFDRYGKLIKQITPSGQGWDGTFNGQMMPSTDYWFTVKYIEDGAERVFKAHFAMKR